MVEGRMNSARLILSDAVSPIPVLFVAGLITISSTLLFAADQRPRVFITDSQSWEVVGSAAGSGGTFASRTQGGARPQTAEIIKTFGERCQQVVVNNKQERADYVVVLDHEGGKGYLLRRNKISVFNKDGDAIVSRSTRSLGNSVQDGCDAIVRDWTGHNSVAAPIAPATPLLRQGTVTSRPVQQSTFVTPTAMNAPVPAVLPRALPSTPASAPPKIAETKSGASVGTVSVTSDPAGAEIFIDSVGYGQAPAILKLPRGKHSIQIVRQGYKDWTSELEVRENSIINVTANLTK
jgi:hypothetical protein